MDWVGLYRCRSSALALPPQFHVGLFFWLHWYHGLPPEVSLKAPHIDSNLRSLQSIRAHIQLSSKKLVLLGLIWFDKSRSLFTIVVNLCRRSYVEADMFADGTLFQRLSCSGVTCQRRPTLLSLHLPNKVCRKSLSFISIAVFSTKYWHILDLEGREAPFSAFSCAQQLLS